MKPSSNALGSNLQKGQKNGTIQYEELCGMNALRLSDNVQSSSRPARAVCLESNIQYLWT